MRLFSRAKVLAFVSLLALLFPQSLTVSVIAQTAENGAKPIIDWQKRQTAGERLRVYGDDLLGDSIDPNSGSLTFEHTDVSVPGNSGLEVAIMRRITPGTLYDEHINVDFGDWELVVPKISAVASTQYGWAGNRCSGSWEQGFPDVTHGGGPAHPLVVTPGKQYSNGVTMDIPGQGSQEILRIGTNSIYPTGAIASTVNEWYFTCTTAVNGGQGFIGHAPNGDKYHFKRVIVRDYKEIGFAGDTFNVDRVKVILAATEVRDVNDNWVKYDYDTQNRLTKIHSKDLRSITLNYRNTGNPLLITSVVANGRVWSYDYQDSNLTLPDYDVNFSTAQPKFQGKMLTTVTQPDNYSWQFNLDAMRAEASPQAVICSRPNYTMTVQHPYGVLGTFKIEDLQHRQAHAYYTYVARNCFDDNGIEPPPPGGGPDPLPPAEILSSRTMSVVEKTLSSTNMETATWLFAYEQDDPCVGLPANFCDYSTDTGGDGGDNPPPFCDLFPEFCICEDPDNPDLCTIEDIPDNTAQAYLSTSQSILQSIYSQAVDKNGNIIKSNTNSNPSLVPYIQNPPSRAIFLANEGGPHFTDDLFSAGGEDILDYTNWTEVTQPNGAVIRYYHLWRHLPVASGKLVKTEVLDGGTVMDSVVQVYGQHGCNGSPLNRHPMNAPGECPTHTIETMQERDGDTFKSEYLYNMEKSQADYSFGNAVQETTHSFLGGTTPRIKTTSYIHKEDVWVLGLPFHISRADGGGDVFFYDDKGRKTFEDIHGGQGLPILSIDQMARFLS